MAPRRCRKVAYHEAGHAVAHHFLRLSGVTTRVTIHPDDLGDYNATRHPVNEARGLHSSGRRLAPIVGHSVDREQLHHELIALLAGHAAGWVFAGESLQEAKSDPKADEELQRHSDGSDDYSRAVTLLLDADPFDVQAALKSIPDHAKSRVPAEVLMDRYFRPASAEHTYRVLADLEARWREALQFVVEKWPHVHAVADALWSKSVLSGEEVTEIIERVEDRVRQIPPGLESVLKQLCGERAHGEEG